MSTTTLPPRSEEHADPSACPPTAGGRRALRGARSEALARALVGQRIGTRVVVAYVGDSGHLRYAVRLRCDCGDEAVVRAVNVLDTATCATCSRRAGNAPRVERTATIDGDTPYVDDVAAQRFVFAHPDGATLEEIAEAMGLTRERIRQIEEMALAKLAKRMRLAGITAEDAQEALACARRTR